MEQQKSLIFTVNASVWETWGFLSDILQVGSCVPGVARVDLIDPEKKVSRWVYTVKVGFVTKTFKIVTGMTHQSPPYMAEFEGCSEDGFIRISGSIKIKPENACLTSVCYALSASAGDSIPAGIRALVESLMRERAQREAEQFAANVKARIEGVSA